MTEENSDTVPAPIEEPTADLAVGDAAHPVQDAALDEALQQLGFDEFRPGQREAITTLIEGGQLLLVAPTGGGKSLIYQLPACLLPGTTLVVSPLISLMNDQVSALEERGVAATYLASTLDNQELRRRQAAMVAGEYKLVYVAPERLVHMGFRSLLVELDCPLIAIDEAHCISEWGHDFRPEYGQIGELLNALPNSRVLACTATATPVVRDEILEKLGLPADTPQMLRGFARPNLALSVMELDSKRQREQAVDEALGRCLGRPGDQRGTAIIYAPTRKSTDQEAARLRAAGWVSDAYHAGHGGALRESTQRAFAAGELEVVVATNAFGMGIDRADVRLVLHLAPPGSVEAYYQEVGRAGRDGHPADGLLITGPGDLGLRRRLLERDAGMDVGFGGDEHAEQHLAHKWNMFLELMRWAEGGSCRHDAILRYFGDEEETLEGCGRCDVCKAWDGGEVDAAETALIVRKALSGVARVHGRFGLSAAARLLKGAPDERLARAGLDAVRTFGILSDRDEEWLSRLLRRCVTAGWIDFRGGDRPVVVLTPEGEDVMRDRRPARLLLPAKHKLVPKSSSSNRRAKGSRRAAAGDEALDVADRTLFDELRAWRLGLARARGVPPYVVASDRTLRDVARRRPTDIDGLMQVHGIGPSKAERYGEGLLAVVRGETPSAEDETQPDTEPDAKGGPASDAGAPHERVEFFDEQRDGGGYAE